MSEFVLVILVTMGLSKDPSTYELRVPKKTYKQCVEDSKTYKFPFEDLHRVISVKTRCEKVIGKEKQFKNEKSV